MSYPHDDDGDALRRVAEEGSDMSKSMRIDFAVLAPNIDAAEAIAKAARPLRYETRIDQDSESGRWTCYCSREMLATNEAIVDAQRELDAISKPFSGCCDGWGTFGNKQ